MTAPRRHRVLIVEDDRAAVEGLRALLVGLGHEVTVATNGHAGLEAVLIDRADVVVCDLGLPDIDGFEIGLRLRADPRTNNVRLIAITGYRREAAAGARASGFDAYLMKPIDPVRLSRAIQGDP
jgi:CheY-like chemotaxis protein